MARNEKLTETETQGFETLGYLASIMGDQLPNRIDNGLTVGQFHAVLNGADKARNVVMAEINEMISAVDRWFADNTVSSNLHCESAIDTGVAVGDFAKTGRR
jgi:hypothetical protein